MNKDKAMSLVRKHSFLCDHKDDPRTVIDVDDVELIINAMPEDEPTIAKSRFDKWFHREGMGRDEDDEWVWEMLRPAYFAWLDREET